MIFRARKNFYPFFSLDGWSKGDEQHAPHDVLSSEENIESLVEHRQTLKTLDKNIDALPHKLKTALILFTLEGHSQDECAQILGVTAKTIETRVYRARKILQQKISEKL